MHRLNAERRREGRKERDRRRLTEEMGDGEKVSDQKAALCAKAERACSIWGEERERESVLLYVPKQEWLQEREGEMMLDAERQMD